MFRKQEVNPTEEWVIDIFGHTVPLKAPVAFIESLMCMLLAYTMFYVGGSVALATLEYASTPHSSCNSAGVCTYCIPYASGVYINYNCTSVDLKNGTKASPDFQYATNQTFNITVN